MSIVQTNIRYSYNILIKDIEQLKQTYPFLKVEYIGNSVLGNSIPCIKIGTGNKEVFYNASFHANEWITTIVLMKFIEDYSYAYANDGKIYNYSARDLFNDTTLYVVPMVNPDGVNLVTGRLRPGTTYFNKASTIASNYPDISFPSGWKANINGVDLNLQFPAGWLQAKQIKYEQGFTSPAPRDFVGFGPLTEPEALNVYNFTLSHNFNLILAYHSQGKVIYWRFSGFNPPKSEYIGRQFANSSGYSLESTPYSSSFAGYKDWFIQYYNKPGYTIEVGLGENSLPLSQFSEIYNDNLGILTLGMALT